VPPESRPDQLTHYTSRRVTFGRHVFLRRHQLEAVELLEIHIDELVTQVERHKIGVFEVRRSAIVFHPPRYESDRARRQVRERRADSLVWTAGGCETTTNDANH